MVERIGDNDAIVTRFLRDANFRQTVADALVREVYEALEKPEGEPNARSAR